MTDKEMEQRIERLENCLMLLVKSLSNYSDHDHSDDCDPYYSAPHLFNSELEKIEYMLSND